MDTINNTVYSYSDLKSKQLMWEIVKVNIREFSIKYSKLKANRKAKTIKNVQDEIDVISNKVLLLESKNVLSKEETDTLHYLHLRKAELQSNLKNFFDSKSKGYSICSRAKWIKEGEIGSRYFLGLEKQRQANNVIRKVKHEDNTIIEGNKALSEIVDFYTKLYKKRDTPRDKIKEYLNKFTHTQKLSEKERKVSENQITLEEIFFAVEKLKDNKAPGVDGLTPEFYKMFWDKLESLYYDMINESFTKGILPSSTHQSVITLIHKKGEKELLTNYRPISLTNYDYKILTIILARRLQCIMQNLIAKDQTGYIKNRYIGVNARIVCDIIDLCEKNRKPGAMLCLDFEKAFDSLNWDFMFSALEKYGFGSNFIKWIRILYEQNSFCIKNNGYLSKESTMERGVRQGCAVSALLFILALEFLAEDIRKKENIKGIKLYRKESYISLYADDITLTLNDEISVLNALETITNLSTVSGLKLNINKCEGLWLGSFSNNPNIFQNIKFNHGPIKCLGLYIDRNMEDCQTLNWDQKLAGIEELLLKWGSRKLTLFGKVQIINLLALPKLTYFFSILPVSMALIHKIEKILLFFLWGKNHKVKKNSHY